VPSAPRDITDSISARAEQHVQRPILRSTSLGAHLQAKPIALDALLHALSIGTMRAPLGLIKCADPHHPNIAPDRASKKVKKAECSSFAKNLPDHFRKSKKQMCKHPFSDSFWETGPLSAQ
jgi:hypothetical protein